MPQNPIAWNVVVVGAWNQAILTPAGIQRRLFELPPETPVEIEVAIDRPAPFRVKHKGLIVTVSSNSLVIETELATPTELARAAELAGHALRDLPETPVVAAGLNLSYSVSKTAEPIALMLVSSIDNALADKGYVIGSRNIRRSVALSSGRLNVDLSEREDDFSLTFNFELFSADSSQLQEWVKHTSEYCARARSLACEVFGLDADEDTTHDSN